MAHALGAQNLVWKQLVKAQTKFLRAE